ncbi:hypothetical protein [Aquitalea pelogenes]|uniref:hypothetical protein n=1 Tax=Aquitalea pelogenes TaxID=1293573 RepID=UPI0035B254C5
MKELDFEKHNKLLEKTGYAIVVINTEVQTTYNLMKYEPSNNFFISGLAKIFPRLNFTVIKSAASLDGLAVDVFKILEENRQIINSRVEGDFIYIGE